MDGAANIGGGDVVVGIVGAIGAIGVIVFIGGEAIMGAAASEML